MADREQTHSSNRPVDPFIVLEAVNSVALSHAEDCGCTTCRAAGGDKDALAQVFAHLMPQNDVPGAGWS